MKEKFVNKGLAFIEKYQTCDDVKRIRLKYGFEALFSLITKMSVVIIINLILNSFIELVVFTIFFSLLRTFSFGFHAKNNISCWIMTVLIFTLFPLIIKYTTISNVFILTVVIIGFISVLLFSPADTPKRPLVRRNERISLKIKTLMFLIIYSTILLITKNDLIKEAITVSIILESILINPIFYFIMFTPFNNYKKLSTV